MPTFCPHYDPEGVTWQYEAPLTEWGSCDSGYQIARYWVCVDTDAAACSDGPYYFSGDYFFNDGDWEALTGLPAEAWWMSNQGFTTGSFVPPEGGGGGSFPELSQSDIALIAGKVLLIFAVVFSIRMVYRLIINR